MAFSTTLLIPGQPISLPKSSTNGITPPARPGRGAYLDPQGVLRASVVGRVAWDETQGGGGGGIVSVVAAGVVGAGGGALPGGGAVPEIGSVVTGTVSRGPTIKGEGPASVGFARNGMPARDGARSPWLLLDRLTTQTYLARVFSFSTFIFAFSPPSFRCDDSAILRRPPYLVALLSVR